LGCLPLAWQAGQIALNEYDQRSLVRANAVTIQLHLLAGVLMAAGLLFSDQITRIIR
jgi:hypothetical protein